MGPRFDLLLGQRGEPAFHKGEPRGTGGREVHGEPGMLGELLSHSPRFVRPVIVENQMEVEWGGDGVVDGVQEAKELPTPMAAMALPDGPSGRNVQRGGQGRGPMAT